MNIDLIMLDELAIFPLTSTQIMFHLPTVNNCNDYYNNQQSNSSLKIRELLSDWEEMREYTPITGHVMKLGYCWSKGK